MCWQCQAICRKCLHLLAFRDHSIQSQHVVQPVMICGSTHNYTGHQKSKPLQSDFGTTT